MTISLLLLAAVAEPAALTPTNKWAVEYAADMCVLSRDFGAGEDKVTLALRPLPMSTQSEVALLTQDNAPTKLKGRAEIVLLPAGHPVSGSYGRFPMPHGPGRVVTMYFEDDALNGLEKAGEIDIRLDGQTRRLAVPGIAGAMAALSTCQDDLLTGWGIDPQERKAESVHVTGNPARFFGPDVYPSDAVANHEQGRVIVVASVTASGRVDGCKVTVTSGSKSLDETTCRIMRTQGRFTPARDKEGDAVASHYVMPVRWVLPAG